VKIVVIYKTSLKGAVIMESLLKYGVLILELPVLNHNKVSQKRIWVKDNSYNKGILPKAYSSYINDFINSDGLIEISRKNIFDETNIVKKIIEIFIWGYPTGGSGKNIKLCLKQIKQLEIICKSILNRNLQLEEYHEVIQKFKSIKGLGSSTWTKFMYFFQTKIEDVPTLIFDAKIEKSLEQTQFAEFDYLKNLKHDNVEHFLNYINGIDKVSRELGVSTDRIELFLFYFNLNYTF